MKQATDVDQQISMLKERGVGVGDEKKAKEILLDVGYYRLGFYLFPFEASYPNLDQRTHEVKAGTKLSDAVALYYFDFDIRNVLMRYISRIEVAFRTYMTYRLSNKYADKPRWFVDEEVVDSSFRQSFDDRHYAIIKKSGTIRCHHSKYKQDKYAPVWKTLEFMTLGGVLDLYRNLKKNEDKLEVSKHFGVQQTAVFENYMESMRCVRNICAHGAVLYDARLSRQLRKGPAGSMEEPEERARVGGAIKVIAYMLGRVSANRLHDMVLQLNDAYMTAIRVSPKLQGVIEKASLLKWDLQSISQLESYIR
ncbi:MAG: Abi family protein [Bacteroidales bacterium]|nr:Abi family protein [Bacteroidales bacterium]